MNLSKQTCIALDIVAAPVLVHGLALARIE